MYYTAKTRIEAGEDLISRSYLEIPVHFLEQMGITDDTPIKVTADSASNSLIITIMETPE